MKAVKKALLFLTIFVVTYFMILLIFANIRFEDNLSLMHKLSPFKSAPGDMNYSLVKFRELEKKDNIDVLFLGSSITLRGVDPRVLKKHDIRAFNMATTIQSPFNAYYLLKRYLEKVKPKLVVYGCYFATISHRDGIESMYDLVVNTGFSKEMLEMSLATKNLTAINFTLSTYLGRIGYPLSNYRQKDVKNSSYVKGGMMSSRSHANEEDFEKIEEEYVNIEDMQKKYLNKLINYVEDRGYKIVLITLPVPEELRRKISNYTEIKKYFERSGEEHGVDYIDFNDLMSLDKYKYYIDYQHLNAMGADKFTEKLAEVFSEKRYFPQN